MAPVSLLAFDALLLAAAASDVRRYQIPNALALALGSLSYWENQLIDRMRLRNAS